MRSHRYSIRAFRGHTAKKKKNIVDDRFFQGCRPDQIYMKTYVPIGLFDIIYYFLHASIIIINFIIIYWLVQLAQLHN